MTSLTCLVTQGCPSPHDQRLALAEHAMITLTCRVTQSRSSLTAKNRTMVVSSKSRHRSKPAHMHDSTSTQFPPDWQNKGQVMPKLAADQSDQLGHTLIPGERLGPPSVTRQVNEVII